MHPTPDTTPDPQPPAEPPTFAHAWETWLGYRACGSRPLRLSTLADYRSIYRCHLERHIGEVPLDAIDGATIARLVVALSAAGVSPKRLANVLVPLRACLRWHYRLGLAARDPSAWFDAAAPPAHERTILTLHEIESLVAATPAHYRPYITFAVYTGMRCGEIRALTWPDIDLEARSARINKTLYRGHLQRSTKSGHNRDVPIPRHVADVLAIWRTACPSSAEGLLFPQPNGRPIDPDNFRGRIFKPAIARAGLPPTTRFHDLRHTCASLYLQHGATVREVMEICGWRQMQTALRYLHTGDTLLAAADRLSAARTNANAPPQ